MKAPPGGSLQGIRGQMLFAYGHTSRTIPHVLCAMPPDVRFSCAPKKEAPRRTFSHVSIRSHLGAGIRYRRCSANMAFKPRSPGARARTDLKQTQSPEELVQASPHTCAATPVPSLCPTARRWACHTWAQPCCPAEFTPLFCGFWNRGCASFYQIAATHGTLIETLLQPPLYYLARRGFGTDRLIFHLDPFPGPLGKGGVVC